MFNIIAIQSFTIILILFILVFIRKSIIHLSDEVSRLEYHLTYLDRAVWFISGNTILGATEKDRDELGEEILQLRKKQREGIAKRLSIFIDRFDTKIMEEYRHGTNQKETNTTTGKGS